MMKLLDKKTIFLIPLIIIILDRITKVAAQHYLKDRVQPVIVIKGFFNLIFSTNRGALFGFLDTLSDPLRFIVLSLIPLSIVILLIVILIRLRPGEKMLSLGMSFILGGAVGNLIDRMRYGEVIDFLDLYLGRYRWPTFNLADSFISTGIAMIFLDMIFMRPEKK